MQNLYPNRLRASSWFALFCLVHIIGWTLIPALVRYNLPLDAIEGTIWGHQLEWGYDKNPFMNGWLTAFAVYLGGASGWMTYLFCQLSVGASFWSVYQLGKKILSPLYAVSAVLLLEGMQYFNFHALDFNDNTLEVGLWALCIYFFYDAVKNNDKKNWILTGVFAALSLMAKYYTLALLAAMSLFLLCDASNRQKLLSKAPYYGLICFLAIIIPHIIWLFHHDFITIHYVFERASNKAHWTNHFFFPAQFAWQQLQVCIPSLLLFLALILGKKPIFSTNKKQLTSFDRQFLFAMGLGPFLLTVLLSLLFGITLRAGWGMPLLSLWPLLLLALTQPHVTTAKFYRFLTIVFVSLALLLSAYAISLIDSKDESTANFPGQEIARVITETWHDRYHTPLHYVAGSRWVGGNVEFYSEDHPSVFIEWNQQRAPWINTEDFAKKGAVFIWSITDRESMPEEVARRYPRLSAVQVMHFNWQRNKHHLAPIEIGVAWLPPGK